MTSISLESQLSEVLGGLPITRRTEHGFQYFVATLPSTDPSLVRLAYKVDTQCLYKTFKENRYTCTGHINEDTQQIEMLLGPIQLGGDGSGYGNKDAQRFSTFISALRENNARAIIEQAIPGATVDTSGSESVNHKWESQISQALSGLKVTSRTGREGTFEEGVTFEAILPPCTEDEAFRLATAIDKQLEYVLDFRCSSAPTEDKTGFKLVIGPVEYPASEVRELLKCIRYSKVSDTITQFRAAAADTTSPLARLQQTVGLPVKQQGETFTIGWPNPDWDVHYATGEIFPKLDRLLPPELSRFRFAAAKQGDWVIEMRRLSPDPINANEWEEFIKFFARDDVQTILHGKKRAAATPSAICNPTAADVKDELRYGYSEADRAYALASSGLHSRFKGLEVHASSISSFSPHSGFAIEAKNYEQARRIFTALNSICEKEPLFKKPNKTHALWAGMGTFIPGRYGYDQRLVYGWDERNNKLPNQTIILSNRYFDTEEKAKHSIALLEKYRDLIESAITGINFPADLTVSASQKPSVRR